MTPWLQDADVTLWHGDVLAVLPELPAESVDCVVTSPPYWGLRDYGTGEWEGGDAECDHTPAPGKSAGQRADRTFTLAEIYRQSCGKCGATRIDQQLGLEPTPEQYVERMVEVFREIRRVLAPHGTVWLNLGDSYASQGGPLTYDFNSIMGGKPEVQDYQVNRRAPAGLKPKDLVGIPWRVAFALQADGWYLRSDIIWSKPNPMPESVTDRPTKAHEYVFLLSKQPRYFFDQEAVREPAEWAWWGTQTNHKHEGQPTGAGAIPKASNRAEVAERMGHKRNIRSVWEIATQPYPEAHFATFPEELARRCIAAGCPEAVCRVCGKARERVVEALPYPRDATAHRGRSTWADGSGRNDGDITRSGQEFNRWRAENPGTQTWTDCGHADYRPGIVLDPFMGSGTVAHVARKLGRHALGIDLNSEYLELAAKRLAQQSLFALEPELQVAQGAQEVTLGG